MKSRIYVDLKITQDEYLRWYSGSVTSVYAHSIDGRSVNFPAGILQQFITHNGISGRFEIEFDKNNKFKGISRVLG